MFHVKQLTISLNTQKKCLQAAVIIACIVPLSAGLLGMTQGAEMLGGGGFALFLLLRALIAGAGFSSHSSSSTDSQPVIPNFPMPHHTTPSASPMPGAPATPNFPTGSGFPAMPTPHHVYTPPSFAPEFPSPPVYHSAPFTPNIPSPMPGGGSPRGR